LNPPSRVTVRAFALVWLVAAGAAVAAADGRRAGLGAILRGRLGMAPATPADQAPGEGESDEVETKRRRLEESAPAAASSKRANYLSWDDYFMSVAFLSAMRSKDPSTQVGACIVNAENRIVGIGYNGFPTGCSDDKLPWSRQGSDKLDTKYMYVVHAEVNAILNKNSASVSGCRMYVALFPCNECAKLIIQSGITEVIFLCDKYHDLPEFVASRRMLDLAGVRYRQHSPKSNQVVIDFGLDKPGNALSPHQAAAAYQEARAQSPMLGRGHQNSGTRAREDEAAEETLDAAVRDGLGSEDRAHGEGNTRGQDAAQKSAEAAVESGSSSSNIPYCAEFIPTLLQWSTLRC